MTIVNPLAAPSVISQSINHSGTTVEERQVGLRMEQIVRATVVEGGLDRALLEMEHRHYRAQGELELQTGQKLTLQVLQTHPRLEFRVLNDQLAGRLNQLLPLLTRSFDWVQLVSGLQQQQPANQQLPVSTQQVYVQLQNLLQPGGQLPNQLGDEVLRLAGMLRQLGLPVSERAVAVPFAFSAVPVENVSASSAPGQSPELLASGIIRDLQQQLQQLPQNLGSRQSQPQAWVVETRNLLLPLQQGNLLGQLPTVQLAELSALLGQVQQQPQLPPQFTGELGRLVAQLNLAQQSGVTPQLPAASKAAALPLPAFPIEPQVALLGGVAEHQQAATVYRTPANAPPLAMSGPPIPAQQVSVDLDKLLAQVQQLQTEKGALPPELTGKLEGLLDRFNQLPQVPNSSVAVLPGLEMLSSQLTQIVQQAVMRPAGGQLGMLSQLFGFHLETELLQGKKKDALASLKLSLLGLRDFLGEKGSEPLQRLELLQLCKAKLAEEQVQFLPLLFPELEEGYLYVEKQREPEQDQDSEPPLQLSIALRVSALGDMRIDMLYDEQGLHLRVACEDQEKMAYLQGCSAELQAAIETVPLQGVSFAADAQVPTRQLQERLLPDALGMLDARI